jgi:two-component system response regulator RegA
MIDSSAIPCGDNGAAPALLIVDDDATFAQVLARALGKRGYRTLTAHTIADATALASNQQPTYAVVDLKLADTSGLVLIEQLVALVPGINIIMLTGYASIATAVEAVKLGATHYLCKPANVDEILDAFTLGSGNSEVDLPENPLSVDRLEWEHIQKVLQDNGGNISATARILGMHRRTLQRKLQKRPARH